MARGACQSSGMPPCKTAAPFSQDEQSRKSAHLLCMIGICPHTNVLPSPPPVFTAGFELYNLDADPYEVSNYFRTAPKASKCNA